MTSRKGTISVNTNDIFPIIKKWLYSEHDIFLRELVANATDAITKRATLARTQNQEIPTGKITVSVDKAAKTISIEDNGLGMTEAEVEKYIAQLAFSGAEEFVQKMKSEGNTPGNDIIGKFGLGFYSAFMVSNRVEVESLSMNAGSTPTKWVCEGETDYTFEASTKSDVGTKITLHINAESEEFLNAWKVSSTLKKFCDFMPYEIFVKDAEAKEESAHPGVINETQPIWKKDPSTLKDEDYKEFYRKQFPMDGEPLFWIHLKVDHPFTLDGVLFFPKLNPNKPFNESNIKLYNKQVFVSNNVKDIVPEFLSLLKGSIDSSDIPLNVSRSSLQGDPNIKKISNYVIKKVAESLKKLFNNDRARYETIWEDIQLFLKYGAISDNKFDEMMRDFVIFKNSDNKYVTLKEYTASIPEAYKTKMEGKVLYFEKGKSDYALRRELLSQGLQALETESYIDPHFTQHVEFTKLGDATYKFVSVDSEIASLLEQDATTDSDIKVKDLFTDILIGKTENKTEEEEDLDSLNHGGLKDIEIVKIKNSKAPAYFKVDEQMKRMNQMAKNMGNDSMFPVKKTLVINPGSPLIQNALKLHEKGNDALVKKIAHHVEDLAHISSEGLKHEDREAFVARTQELMQELTNLAL
ncbi:molecular chaperone HtpG [Bacteriovorax stolpii]|uniref:Molecular chaperone HtpG n=1 Tax=Bacteriovorax stolpii TaxID=960 RepID=A0A2K9NTC6_BACTC|nr:molecular chaperone HtpG [Bacteriovorax stolpii]AUN98748.1 molecular chaperone HtpG [Bacteriovorax stolpii]TDP55736.1 molecular chaperone HtpG [Bacteriovorax stolpii]